MPAASPGSGVRNHLFQLLLRQYIEHKNAANLRIHVVSNGVLWTALVTVLSQVPLPLPVPSPFANLGAVFALGSALYWLPIDAFVPALVLAWTAAWAWLPFVPWGPGHGWLAGIALPLVALTAAGLAAFFAHVYHDEHAPYLDTGNARGDALETAHAVFWGPFYFWLCALLVRGYRPGLRAELDAAERRRILRHARATQALCVPQSFDDLCDVVRETAREGRRIRMVGSGFTWAGWVPTDETLVFCERLDRVEVDLSDPDHPAIWADCGATGRRLRAALSEAGLPFPRDVLPGPARVAGALPLGDRCIGLDLVDEAGTRRLVSNGVPSAADVVARVRLRAG